MVLAKMRRPFGDAVGEYVEVLLEQDDVGGVLGDVGGRVDRNADVGRVQGEGVVDAVAEERDAAAALALDAHDPGLVLRADAGEHGRCRRWRRPGASSSRAATWVPVIAAPSVRPEVVTDLDRDGRVVSGDDLDRDPEAGQPLQARGRRRVSVGRGRPGIRSGAGCARRPPWARCSVVTARVATATTRLPAANSVAKASRAARGTSRHRSNTVSGAPFVTSVSCCRLSLTRTETMLRSWSNGSTPSRVQAVTAASCAATSGAFHSAMSSGLPPTAVPSAAVFSVATQSPPQHRVGVAAGRLPLAATARV